MNVILFEDSHVDRLFPITAGRPAFAITCGGYRLIDLIKDGCGAAAYLVRPHLRAVVMADCPPPVPLKSGSHPILWLNAAIVPSVSVLGCIKQLTASGQPGIVWADDQIAAAITPAASPPDAKQMTFEHLHRYLTQLNLPRLEVDIPLLAYPHDVIRQHLKIIRENLDHRLKHGSYREVADGVFCAGESCLGQYLVTKTNDGPILLEEGVSVGPFCFLTGPAYIGRGARINEHSALKDAVCLGHTTKVGGEVEASIIEPYSNKQHHGFLGHSYLGSWINLGAGTCNSDLKNTYGEVNMEYYGRKVPSGMQFVGCIMGDYAKSAVNTSIFTGKVIGAGSLLYGFVTTNVPSFVNYARSFGQITEIPVDVLISTQARMFSRRSVTQRECDIQLLHDMYHLTRRERQIADEPLSL